jgi:di/tricarboxylate transporter
VPEPGVLTPEMMAVLGVLALTVALFVTEIVRVDVAAVLIMVLLGLTGMVAPEHLFDGFASNAVISIIAVMIIGAGLDRTGIMSHVAAKILQVGGHTERRIIAFIASTVGAISSFMQNVGAAALFLPVVSRISARTGLPLSRLLMPMGFCAILGGTITMVGSSPLILLNDLLLTSNRALPPGVEPMATFNLFDVTPVGLALVATGILYFLLLGRYILPEVKSEGTEPASTMDYFREVYRIEGELYELVVPTEGRLAGLTVGAIESTHPELFVLALRTADDLRLAPPRDIRIEPGSLLGIMGPREDVQRFAERYALRLKPALESLQEALNPSRAGISEVVVRPGGALVGKTIGEIRMRKRYGTSVLAVYRGDSAVRTDLRGLRLQAGDTLVLHSSWADLTALAEDRSFVVVTDFPREQTRPHKIGFALFFFLVALGLILFTDLRLSVALLTGALGMIVTGVLSIDEAYEAVSWKTVFLLASLIPLGLAVETTGTAAWIAHNVLTTLEGVPIWVLQAAVALLATGFTLVMSNVGATVLLVPLAVNIALGAGADPRVFALTVAIATSNSFIIPTHQVNALIMGPAGYRVKDFMRAGGIMTVLFLVVMMVMLNVVF